MTTSETDQFLASSPERVQLLEYLSTTSGRPAAIADALSFPRRSVQRYLGQFVERDWVSKDGGRYRLTVPGELVLDEHTRYLETIDQIETFTPLFRELPDVDHTPNPRWLENSTLAVATADNPQAPVHHYIETVRSFETDHVRMVAPVLSRLFHDVHAKLALDGVYTELVLSKAMVDRAQELNPTEFKLVVSVDVLDFYEYPDPISFGLTLSDDQLLLGGYDDDGQLRACVSATNTEILEWGERLFERYRDQTNAIDPPISFPFKFRR